MTNMILAFILTCNLVLLSIVIFAILRVKRGYDAFKAYVTPVSSDQPSPLAQTIDATSTILARAVVAQAKTTFMGVQSGAARAEKALAGDIAEDLLSAQSPVAGALLSQFPAVRKTLRRNPQLLDMAIGMLGNLGKGPSSVKNNHSETQPLFKL